MGRPKALLPIRGRAFLENILDAISHTSIEDTIVVLGHHREQIERSLRLPSVVFNPAYEQGMITSFQAGIRGLSWDASGAFLFLVEHRLASEGAVKLRVE